jgi:hypothetical protein
MEHTVMGRAELKNIIKSSSGKGTDPHGLTLKRPSPTQPSGWLHLPFIETLIVIKNIIISPVTSNLGWLIQAREEYRSKQKELSFQHCNPYHL